MPPDDDTPAHYLKLPQSPATPDPDYTPGSIEQQLLDFLAVEGRANPWMMRKRLGWRGQKVNDYLKPLLAAKWVVHPLVYDTDAGEWVESHALYQYNAHGVYAPGRMPRTGGPSGDTSGE